MIMKNNKAPQKVRKY